MYNKLFTKILDSSIWLESDATRLVWLTLLAAMDEDGFAQFASVANLAHRARVSLDACVEAVRCLESDDPNSGDPDNHGRRLERVDGGWMVLNSGKYRQMVTRIVAREQTRERVRRFRSKVGNADVTVANDRVTPSEAETEAHTDTKTPSGGRSAWESRFESWWSAYPKKTAKNAAVKAWRKINPDDALLSQMLDALRWQARQPNWTKDGGAFIPYPATYLNSGSYLDEPFFAPSEVARSSVPSPAETAKMIADRIAMAGK